MTPVTGETAQPPATSLELPSAALATSKPSWLKSARGSEARPVWTALAVALGAAASWSSVSTKLPSGARPGPLLGSRPSARTSSRTPVMSVRSVSATNVKTPFVLVPPTVIEPSASFVKEAPPVAVSDFGSRIAQWLTIAPAWAFSQAASLPGMVGLVGLQVGLELCRPGRPVLFLQSEPGGQIFLIGRQRGLGRGDRGQAVAFELGPPKCELDLALAQVLGQLAVVVVDRLQVVPAGRDLLGSRRAVEDSQEEIVDQPGVVVLAGHQLGQLVVRVGDGVSQGRPADQGHHRSQLQPAGSIALAGALAGRTAESRQEPAGQLDSGIGQGRGAGSRGHARELRRRAGHPVDRVEQHLGRQPPGDRVRIVRPVIGVPVVRSRSRADTFGTCRSGARCGGR